MTAIHKKHSRIHVKTVAMIVIEVTRMFPLLLKIEGILDTN